MKYHNKSKQQAYFTSIQIQTNVLNNLSCHTVILVIKIY